MEITLDGISESLTTLLDPAVYTNNPRVINTVYTVALPRLSALIKEAPPTLDAYLKSPGANYAFADELLSRVEAAKEYRKYVESVYISLQLSGADFKAHTSDPV